MKKLKNRLFSSNSGIVFLAIIILAAFIGIRNPSFLGIPSLLTLSRAMIVMLIFALGELVVIIGGGIDVSFPAIANFALYLSAYISVKKNIDSAVLVFVISIVVGTLLGLLNGYLVSKKKVPALIATLGTSTVVNGATLAFLGTAEFSNLPSQLRFLNQMSIYTYTNAEGMTYNLSVFVLVPIVLSIITFVVLKYTVFGRSLYIAGGDPKAAEVTGFNVVKSQMSSYVFSGFLAGLGGAIYMILMNNANSSVLMGSEMLVIAAVVMGGARISGGHGTVLGTVLGIALITLIQNNLVMMGIPSHYQTFVIGLIIIFGTLLTTIKGKSKGGN